MLEELVTAVHEDYEVGTPVRVHHPNIHGLRSLPTAVKPRQGRARTPPRTREPSGYDAGDPC
ncbi:MULTISPECIES: hypothetical protein [unclassified Nonomuraea]|uniref:hypothetical protein n=1 Tax=unclassified Nonomuraea TaxID=2593643 RepID=UPI0033C59B6A